MSDFQVIKYRVIGALVIVGSFSAAWWLLLDQDVKRLQIEKQEILKPLPVERFSIEEPKKPDSVAEPINSAAVNVASDGSVDGDSVSAEQSEMLEVSEPVLPDANAQTEAAASADELVKAKLEMAKPESISTESAKPESVKTDIEKAIPVSEVDMTKPISSALDAEGMPEAWVLQLTSVKSKENAEALKSKLLINNFHAYVKTIDTSDGVTYRVLVGPKLSKVKAAETAQEIESKMGIKSIMIVRFKPGYEE